MKTPDEERLDQIEGRQKTGWKAGELDNDFSYLIRELREHLEMTPAMRKENERLHKKFIDGGWNQVKFLEETCKSLQERLASREPHALEARIEELESENFKLKQAFEGIKL